MGHLPLKPVRFTLRSTLAALTIGALMATLAPMASADELDDERARVGREIGQLGSQRSDLNGRIAGQQETVEQADATNVAAVQALKQAEADLASAKKELAAAEQRVAESKDLDEQRQQELEAAEEALEQAEADVAAAQAAYDALNDRIGQEMNVVTQQQGPLVHLALFLTDADPADVSRMAHMGDQLFDGSALDLDEAERLRVRLDKAKQDADAAEKAATKARQAAARQLEESRDARDDAESLADEVQHLVTDRDNAAKEAAAALDREEQIQDDMEAEAAAVERRIQQRMADADALDSKIGERDRVRAEQERQRRAAEARRQREEARKRAEAAAKAKAAASSKSSSKGSSSAGSSKASSSSKSSSVRKKSSSKRRTSAKRSRARAASSSKMRSSSRSSSRRASSRGFIMPSGARITSPFGMRLHPVTGIYKLHDGTDFGASCGSRIRAASDGVVSERYYNRGYGNRLMIDHGRRSGVNVTTGYNHASRYIVRPGQRVRRGQTIGYVGSTGYSTGCHLHLMVWENGRVRNPMARWFG